ncbi:MAG: hypothetical protein KGJ62_04030 [Armatimonadetes bacterium]|nr:hypothetical protein [Armatimonadota bacterium]
MALAFLLAPLTAYWTADQGMDVIFSLMVPPLAMTLVIACINLVVRRLAPKAALREGELIIFYAMHTVVCTMCAEWMSVVNPAIQSFALQHKQNTAFDTYINPYTSKWFFIPVKDAKLYKDYGYGGYNFAWFWAHLHLWWRYILSWTTLIVCICGGMLCINSLMRDEWTNREKLSFPIIQVPMAVIAVGAGRSNVWRSKYCYVAFFAMFAIDMLNGFHFMFPSVPQINVRFIGDLSQFLPNPPFSAIGWTPIGIFPYMAAIGFFMPTDLLFSCIFFFFFRKAMQVFTYAIGYTDSAGVFGGGSLVPGPPYFSEQSWGAFLALFVGAIWVARSYLKDVWRQIWTGRDENGTGVPHRIAFIGLILSLGAIAWISSKIGIPLWMVAFEVFLFLMFSVALTRLRAQIGAPSHEMAFMGPNQMLVDFVGSSSLPVAGLSRTVTTFYVFNRIHRTHPMPSQLESMKMGETAQFNQRAIFVAVLLATVVGCLLGHLVYIYRGYHFGAQQAGGGRADIVSQITNQHKGPNVVAIVFVVVGFAIVALLDLIRFQFPGFPLHPVGYALAMNFGLDYFWFGLVIVLIVKVFVERIYGLKGHDKLHQVAIGIIVAEFAAETIWSLYAITHHQATYSISINGRLSWDQ